MDQIQLSCSYGLIADIFCEDGKPCKLDRDFENDPNAGHPLTTSMGINAFNLGGDGHNHRGSCIVKDEF